MLGFSGNSRIFLFAHSIDLRKGFEGLSTIITNQISWDLTSGAYFVFLNRRYDRMKILYWDGDGLAIWYKRLEQGSYSIKNLKMGLIDRRDFLMLLEGVTPKRMQKRFKTQ